VRAANTPRPHPILFHSAKAHFSYTRDIFEIL
jgi:hypothetical protein